MESKTGHMMKEIRKTPIFRQLIPQEAGVGWPIPLMKDGKVYVKLSFYGFAQSKERKETILYPPFAIVTLSWPNQVPVEYLNLRFRNPWPEGDWESQAGLFPHAAVAQMTVGQYEELREQLLTMYDEMFETLSCGEKTSAEWDARFGQRLRTLLEPSLEPYYRALGPKFFQHFLTRAAVAGS
ncbi:MAG: hypothetical protein QOD00_2305 [Blastocatellia bacterium]|jgi:hypothetical protein|nr:hypothetical protein [Blastocatellia bacterium]